MKDSYLTISNSSKGLFKVKGSKFISMAHPVNSEEDINSILGKINKEYHDARHICYAWIIQGGGSKFRVHDDGEPSGTAGKPILGQINSKGLTNVLIIVIRYFGGILLGTGGLAHVYKAAAADSLKDILIVEKYFYDTFSIHFGYHNLNLILRTIEEFKGEMFDQDYNLVCNLKVKIRKSLSERFSETFGSTKGDNIEIRLMS